MVIKADANVKKDHDQPKRVARLMKSETDRDTHTGWRAGCGALRVLTQDDESRQSAFLLRDMLNDFSTRYFGALLKKVRKISNTKRLLQEPTDSRVRVELFIILCY